MLNPNQVLGNTGVLGHSSSGSDNGHLKTVVPRQIITVLALVSFCDSFNGFFLRSVITAFGNKFFSLIGGASISPGCVTQCLLIGRQKGIMGDAQMGDTLGMINVKLNSRNSHSALSMSKIFYSKLLLRMEIWLNVPIYKAAVDLYAFSYI